MRKSITAPSIVGILYLVFKMNVATQTDRSHSSVKPTKANFRRIASALSTSFLVGYSPSAALHESLSYQSLVQVQPAGDHATCWLMSYLPIIILVMAPAGPLPFSAGKTKQQKGVTTFSGNFHDTMSKMTQHMTSLGTLHTSLVSHTVTYCARGECNPPNLFLCHILGNHANCDDIR